MLCTVRSSALAATHQFELNIYSFWSTPECESVLLSTQVFLKYTSTNCKIYTNML